MLVSQTSPLGVELFSYVNVVFGRNKCAYLLTRCVKTLLCKCSINPLGLEKCFN